MRTGGGARSSVRAAEGERPTQLAARPYMGSGLVLLLLLFVLRLLFFRKKIEVSGKSAGVGSVSSMGVLLVLFKGGT